MVRFLNIFTPASVLIGLSLLSFVAYSKGIINDHDDILVALGVLLGFALMGITGITIVGIVIYFLVKKQQTSAIWSGVSLIPLILGSLLLAPIINKALRAGEMRDINVYGVDTLRADARTFLDSWEGGNRPHYDGEDIPESIHFLSEGRIAIYPPDRINFTTRGLGSHRGGFYIIAEGGSLPSEDEYGRELVPGIYTWDY